MDIQCYCVGILFNKKAEENQTDNENKNKVKKKEIRKHLTTIKVKR